MNNREWFKQAKYGMMVHFGLYSLLGGEYRGRRTNSYAEWAQSYFAIPSKEYSALAKNFNPTYFNADEWIGLAKECGMQYFVITSKHHDGFALFKSEADPFNVVDATPFGRDIIGELAESCYKHGLKFGLYYSQELDWHDPDGGGYTNPSPCSGVSWHNSWDFGKSAEGKDFSRCFERKIKPQVKEILTKYGDLCLIWFDTPHTITPEQSLELFDMVKQYQPDCLINSRLGNGAYDYVSLGDNEIPSKLPDKMPETKEGDMNDLGGFKYSPYGLYETAATLNDSWGFKYFDQNWKNAEKVYKNKKHLNDMGINYLLNVGPDALGRIPSFSVDILRGAAELEKNEQ
ncbi:MAG: alpha-L-fucosidase [Clostridia bacterium]|nr:alpha-L-fucosidase [Clostridia bacterium]